VNHGGTGDTEEERRLFSVSPVSPWFTLFTLCMLSSIAGQKRPVCTILCRMRTTIRVLAVLALVACSDGPSAPRPPVPSIPLRLCASGWVAYQNEGAAWTRSVGGAGGAGAHEFLATPRLAFAIARTDTLSPYLDVSYLTAEQLAAVHGCHDLAAPPSGAVDVELRGVDLQGYAQVSYGPMQARLIPGHDPLFQGVPWPGENDLTAVRLVSEANGGAWGDRVVLRRAQSYAAGSRTVVDFASAEAFAPAEHRLRWTGPTAHVQINFFTAEGGDSFLHSRVSGRDDTGTTSDAPREDTLHSIPAARLVAGDVHRVSIGGDLRNVTVYYRAPRDIETAFGPPVAAPAFTTIATAPNLRLRLDVPAQPAYDAVMYVVMRQDFGAPRMPMFAQVSLSATREWFGGTPATWTMTIPDFTGVPGFERWLGLSPGLFHYFQIASSRPLTFSDASATDGTVHRTAYRGGDRP
jgi:hypothetical protein